MKYTYKKTAFTKTETYVLESDAIKVYDENNMLINVVSLSNIKSISLVHTPIKAAKEMHQCTVKAQTNKKLVLRNYSYLGLANFKNQTKDYLVFIDELHAKTKTLNIEFKKGINKARYIVMLAFMVAMTAFMIVIAITLFNKGKYAEMGISSLAVILFVFLTITSMARFKPENYNPNNIHKNVLSN